MQQTETVSSQLQEEHHPTATTIRSQCDRMKTTILADTRPDCGANTSLSREITSKHVQNLTHPRSSTAKISYLPSTCPSNPNKQTNGNTAHAASRLGRPEAKPRSTGANSRDCHADLRPAAIPLHTEQGGLMLDIILNDMRENASHSGRETGSQVHDQLGCAWVLVVPSKY